MKKFVFWVCLLAIPAFALMLRPGIYTMHDFHVFRQFEFNKCIQDRTFPCRFSPDAGMGYGEPVFNFYGQVPYWLGQIFHWVGFQIIDSVKILFILSIVLSGVTMFFLARSYWGDMGGVISAVFYMYAPYRAVDVWVRGALPEAFGFVLFPLILLCIKTRRWLALSIFSAILITTHNLSAYMFFPFMVAYWLIESRQLKIIWSGIASIFLSGFYLLPVVWESHLVTVAKTTESYYSYQLHWATLSQLFISRFWGYGGSVWGPNDTLSFSVGHLHWIIPLIVAGALVLKRNFSSKFWIFLALGTVAIFLTHGKSEFLWKLVPGMSFVQFPWRFLSMATVFLSLSVGSIGLLWAKKYLFVLPIVAIGFYIGFFKPDIWRNISDQEQFSGTLWDEQRASALQDFWPKTTTRLPDTFAPDNPEVVSGIGTGQTKYKGAAKQIYDLSIATSSALVHLPAVYFPGWKGSVDGNSVQVYADSDLGQVSLSVPEGQHEIEIDFKNTPARSIGNIISIISLGAIACKKFLFS